MYLYGRMFPLRPFNPPTTICLLKCLLPFLWSSVPSITGTLCPLSGSLSPLRPFLSSVALCLLFNPHTKKFKQIPSLCLYLLTDFFDWKLPTAPLKRLFNVDTAGFLPASLRSQSPLQWKWREYYSAWVTLKRNIVCVMKIFFIKHFSCDKLFITHCDIPKEDLVTKTWL